MTDQPTAGVALKPAHVYVEVSGLTGSGKSAVMGEIEIALKALGLTVEHDADFQAEKNGTHADWQEALDLYKPTVVLSERNVSRAPTDAGGAVSEADLGRYLTLSLAADGIGNAVLSPEEPSEQGYWTLIGSGDNDYQNRVGRLILAALTPAPQAEGDCFECAAPLVGPFCPECNPAIKQALGYAVEAPQPLQQGGDVTRELQDKIEGIILRRHFAGKIEGYTLDMAREIAALFAALAADRDKAVGLITTLANDLEAEIGARASGELPRRIKRDMEIVTEARAFLSSQTGER